MRFPVLDATCTTYQVVEPDAFAFSAGLSNAVLLLPRIVPRLHDASVAPAFGENPLAWDVAQLVAQLQALVDRTGVTTLPSLQEWAVLPNKVQLPLCLCSGTKLASTNTVTNTMLDPP